MNNSKVQLRPNERVDDLITNRLKIIQSTEVFSFSMDAVLLARFGNIPQRGKMMDLCTGNGVIPLLLSTRTQAQIDGLEIQPRLADMAIRNVELNGLGRRLNMKQGDLRQISDMAEIGVYDYITVNPPYLPPHAGDQNMNPHVAAARHEIYCTLEEVITACTQLLKAKGRVAMVHRPARLADIMELMRKARLEPKKIRFVHPKLQAEANMVLIEASKYGRPEVRMLPPLVVYQSNQQYTDELRSIYAGQALELSYNGEGDR